MADVWALLWSKRQNCLHIEPVENWLSKNRQAYGDNRTLMDYQPIYIGDRETCHATAESVRPTLVRRELERDRDLWVIDGTPLPVIEFGEVHLFNQGA